MKTRNSGSSKPHKAADVLILGTGVAALGAARALLRRGKRVVLCAPSAPPAGNATQTSAGILDPFLGTDLSKSFFALKQKSVRQFPALVKSLEHSTRGHAGYRRTGMLFTALTVQETLRLKQRYRRHRRSCFSAKWVEGAEISKRWPELSEKIKAVLFYPEIARILPRRFQQILLADVRRLGGKVMRFRQPLRVLVESGRALGIRTGKSVLYADHVINAAGSWAGEKGLCPAGYKLEPIRGQVLIVRGRLRLQPVLHDLGSTYLVPWEKGTFLLGSTVERAGFKAAVNPAVLKRIHRRAGVLVPAVSTMKKTQSWAGLRPRAPDLLPLIGKTKIPGYWLASWYYRSGIVIGVHAGEKLADWIVSGRRPHEIAFASPLRRSVLRKAD